MHSAHRHYCRFVLGFTLVEAIIVLILTAILSMMAARFISKPIVQYQDLSRRADLSDTANAAVRRISRDLHLALPNSVRSVNSSCLEFVPTYDGGRYRAVADSAGAGNVFNATQSITQFDVLGALSAAPPNNDFVVVYNLGIPGADVYAADNRATLNGASTTTSMSFAAKTFPFASPGYRFQLVANSEQAVSFVCSGVGIDAAGNGTGTLYRAAAYGFVAAPVACAAVNASTPIMAQSVSACQFSYASGASERSGLVSVRLSITRSNEIVSIYHDVNINNVP